MNPGLRVFINAPYDDGGNLSGSPIVEQNIQAVLDTHLKLEAMGFEPYPEIFLRRTLDPYRERATNDAWRSAKAWIQASDVMLRIRTNAMVCRDADLRESYAREHGLRIYYDLNAMVRQLDKG